MAIALPARPYAATTAWPREGTAYDRARNPILRRDEMQPSRLVGLALLDAQFRDESVGSIEQMTHTYAQLGDRLVSVGGMPTAEMFALPCSSWE